MNKIFLSLVTVSSLLLGGCGTNSGFGDLDRFMAEADAKPRGKIEALPEVQVYRGIYI